MRDSAMLFMCVVSMKLAACVSGDSTFDKVGSVASDGCDRLIVRKSIGTVKVGQAISAVEGLLESDDVFVPYSANAGYKLTTCDGSASLIVESDGKPEKVIGISTTSSLFETARGAKVGMSIMALRRLYPEGEISTGVDEGGWIAFKIDELSGYFEFPVQGASPNCLADLKMCDASFYGLKSIRYWTD